MEKYILFGSIINNLFIVFFRISLHKNDYLTPLIKCFDPPKTPTILNL